MRSKLIRSDIEFIDVCKSIIRERVKNDVDNKTKSITRFTKGIANLIKKDKTIKDRLIHSEMQ